MHVQTRQILISALLAALFCACVTLAIPVSEKASQHDLKHLMALIGKLKGAQRVRHTGQTITDPENSNNLALGNLAEDDDDVTDFASDSQQGGASVNKRQGAWSFDYGLGGGRFGKRGYGYAEYGLGGGRFGRDVDHVDPNHDFDNVL